MKGETGFSVSLDGNHQLLSMHVLLTTAMWGSLE